MPFRFPVRASSSNGTEPPTHEASFSAKCFVKPFDFECLDISSLHIYSQVMEANRIIDIEAPVGARCLMFCESFGSEPLGIGPYTEYK